MRGRGPPCAPPPKVGGASVALADLLRLHAGHNPVGLHVGEVASQVLLLLEGLEQCVEVTGSKTLGRDKGDELRSPESHPLRTGSP